MATVQNYNAFLIFGPPGCGKGTVGSKLSYISKLKHISTGELFRSMPPTSENGIIFQQYASRGELLPDEISIRIFGSYLKGLEYSHSFDPHKEILLLDGIPRTAAQAALIGDVVNVCHLLVLDIPDEDVIVERLSGRAKIEGRKDDMNESVIRNRIAEYKAKTAAVLDYYPSEKISHINGMNSPDEVFCDTLQVVIRVRKQLGL
jgi:adenylate kinase